MKGKVKFFDSKRGWGFIEPDDGGQAVFVHFTGIIGEGRRDLIDGQEVEFDVQEEKGKKKAVNVRRIGEE